MQNLENFLACFLFYFHLLVSLKCVRWLTHCQHCQCKLSCPNRRIWEQKFAGQQTGCWFRLKNHLKLTKVHLKFLKILGVIPEERGRRKGGNYEVQKFREICPARACTCLVNMFSLYLNLKLRSQKTDEMMKWSESSEENVPGLSIKMLLNSWLKGKNYQVYYIFTHKKCNRMQDFACKLSKIFRGSYRNPRGGREQPPATTPSTAEGLEWECFAPPGSAVPDAKLTTPS
jgi:hypothetical protein